ncbi:hypothetical protein MMC25_000522 [Agyrium rufum]|nr:hypothetical protein [Agyrium rufum]
MAFPSPSIGDILMLSQLAWKIGCAFTSGRAGAPAEFQEVENELKSLTNAITALAEALDEDSALVARADKKTTEGLNKIVECCRQSLADLESFVERYQDVRRPSETGGLIVQRSWKRILVQHYKTVWWTTEGGTIQSLRNMLLMHIQSISLTVLALQSRSLSRLERVIEPMGEHIDNIHDKLNGNLDVKIEEMHTVILSLQANLESSPMILAQRRDSLTPRYEPQRASSTSPKLDPQRKSAGSGNQSRNSGPIAYPASPEIPELDEDSESSAYSPTNTNDSSTFTKGEDRNRESMLIPSIYSYRIRDSRSPPPQYRSNCASADINNTSLYSSRSSAQPPPQSPRRSRSVQSESQMTNISPVLPPPALEPEASDVADTSFYDDIESLHSQKTQIFRPLSNIATIEEHETFKRHLLRDSAVLCDIRGTSIDYTLPDPDKVGDFKSLQASGPCQIMIVRKKQRLSTKQIRFSTSIWAFSDDRSVRLEQVLADGEEVIPYTLFGLEEKVVLQVPTELKLHATTIDGLPKRTPATHWVSYMFESPDPDNSNQPINLQKVNPVNTLHAPASLFQNALIGRTLLVSAKTRRTMRVHDGLTGAFSFAEQLCALEQLRIFQNPATGGCLALIHYSPNFREGYLAFYLNSSRERITAKNEGDCTIRIKGLAIPIEDRRVPGMSRTNSIDEATLSAAAVPGGFATGTGSESVSGGSADSASTITAATGAKKKKGDKYITAVKIEFYTPEDRRAFREVYREIQGTAFPGER